MVMMSFPHTLGSSRAQYACSLTYNCIELQGHRLTDLLFEEWLEIGGNWMESKLVVSVRNKQASRTVGRMRWLSRHELLTKYGDAATVDDLCERKRRSGDIQAWCRHRNCVATTC